MSLFEGIYKKEALCHYLEQLLEIMCTLFLIIDLSNDIVFLILRDSSK